MLFRHQSCENKSKNDVKEEIMESKFNEIYKDLKDAGGARIVNELNYKEKATAFLLDTCKKMPYAPRISTMMSLSAVFADKVGEIPALVYAFRYSPMSICQNVFIFLVEIESGIRLFAVETDLFCGFCLCEYADRLHKNYGEVELANIPTRINEIIGA